MQYVKFPMSTLRITQGYGLAVDGVSTSVSGGTYSHTGSYALDLGGIGTDAEYLYAPCDVTVMRHYRGTGYNAVWYQSNGEVMCADGQARQLVFLLIHANDNVITELGITVGKQFYQGEPFYKEGTGGGVGTHCHIEVGLAPFTGTGWYQSSHIDDRGTNVWIINNKLIPSDIFYLTDDTNVVEDMRYNWRYLSTDSYIKYTTPMGVRIIPNTGKNVQYFNTASVDDVAGNYLPGDSEYIAVGYTDIADSYGFTYIKFIYDDGSEYWLANLDDRIELFVRQLYVDYEADMRVKILESASSTVEYFNSPDVNDVAGKLTKGTEYVAVGYTEEVDSNGFTYIAFTYDDGNTYYMANLSDRIEVYEYIELDISTLIDCTFFIQAVGTDSYLNVYGNETVANETNVTLYALEDVQAQRWVLKQTDAGLKLFTRLNEAYALNIYTVDDNCTMYTAANNDKDSVIELIDAGDGIYKIMMSSHDKYLSVSGTNVVWSSDDSTSWRFITEDEAFPSNTPSTEFIEEGIDVSDYQGTIDWSKVAASGQKFAIIKAVGTNTNGIYISDNWESNYQGAKDNGIKVGAYLYTYAFNETEAEEELSYLFNALKGKSFEYPIFIDVEDKLLYQNCTKQQITSTIGYMCRRLLEKGYYPAIYTYSNFAINYLDMSQLSEYDLWIADYTGSVTYKGDYSIWQYTSTGSVDGINGNVDMNISYRDYKTIIQERGLNTMAVEKILNTRIQLKYDSYENWSTKNPVLKAGEMAIATIASGETLDHNSVALPQVLIKVGDGTSNYNALPFISAKAADVYSWAKADKKPVYNADEIEGLANYIAGEIQDTNTIYQFKFENDQLIIESQEKGSEEWKEVTKLSITMSTKVDKDTDAVAGNLAQFVEGGNIVDSGEKIGDFMKTAAADAKFATIEQHEGLAEDVSDIDGRLGTAEGDITNLKAKDTELAQAINTEKERAMGIEGGLETRLKAVEDDYLKGADKTELKGLIDDNAEAIEANGELISANAKAIADEIARATEVEGGLEDRIETMELFWEAAQSDETAGKNVIDTLAEIQSYIASDESGASQMAASIKQNADDIDALEGRMDTAEGAIEGLEEKAHTHANAGVLDGISADKVAAWDAAVQTVVGDTGLKATKEGTEVTVAFDEAVTFVLDCGNATF